MRFTICLLLFGISQFAISQPTLTPADFPASYSATGFHSFNITGFTNGSSGADVTWDYSAIAPTTLTPITYSIVPVSEANASSVFPNANFCEKIQTSSTTEYTLYTLDNQSFEMIAAISSFVANYYDSAVTFQFPYTYQSQFTDTQWQLGQPTPPEPITRTYDAYGTLILPNGTYNNVIRQKVVNGFGQIDYYWYGTSPYRLLMRGNLEGNYATLFGETALSSDQQTPLAIQLYPNPTSESFAVSTPEGRMDLKVYDITGKSILEKTDYVSGSLVSLKEFANGIYIVTITDASNKQLFSEKIIKN